MDTHTIKVCRMTLVFFLLFTILSFTGISVISADHEALFVFGDSYADTGNHNKADPALRTPWLPPYGITWPGYPSGRFSNGRVFTDFYASFLQLKHPIPYRVINETIASNGSDGPKVLEGFEGYGVSFAFGGSGVFPTFGPQFPNISAQINQLKDLILKNVVSRNLINSSRVLLVVAGNDYTIFSETQDASKIGLFIPMVVSQIVISLEELYDLGFKTFAVSNLETVGCLPATTFSNNYTSCNETINDELSKVHNTLLASSIANLQIKNSNAKYIILDFFNGFEYVIQDGKLPLRPCCEGINGASCGDVNNNGEALYTVCSNPQKALFWDRDHPTNVGWKAISKTILLR